MANPRNSNPTDSLDRDDNRRLLPNFRNIDWRQLVPEMNKRNAIRAGIVASLIAVGGGIYNFAGSSPEQAEDQVVIGDKRQVYKEKSPSFNYEDNEDGPEAQTLEEIQGSLTFDPDTDTLELTDNFSITVNGETYTDDNVTDILAEDVTDSNMGGKNCTLVLPMRDGTILKLSKTSYHNDFPIPVRPSTVTK
jgi:FlaG/FlaF family flagellin (archaellin)